MKSIRLPFCDELERRLQEPKPLIQFVIGPRQVGKTTGVEQVLEHYNDPFHYVLAEEEPTIGKSWLREQWQLAQSRGPKSLLVIDEIQKVDQWAETIKFLWDSAKKDRKPIRVLLLGSSSLKIHAGARESLSCISVYNFWSISCHYVLRFLGLLPTFRVCVVADFGATHYQTEKMLMRVINLHIYYFPRHYV